MKKKEPKPAKIALSFFYWFCKPEYREELEGDLLERFTINFNRYGKSSANLRFINDVLMLFRPSLIGTIPQLTSNTTLVISKNYKWYYTIALATIVLLLIPLIAMSFTNEVKWKFLDFAVAGILISGFGIAMDRSLRNIKTRINKVLIVIFLFAVLILIWIELAVGIFD